MQFPPRAWPPLGLISACLGLAPCLAAQSGGSVDIYVDWTQPPTKPLPEGVRSIGLRQLQYEASLDKTLIETDEAAVYNSLMGALQDRLSRLAPDIAILRERSAGVWIDNREARAAGGEAVASPVQPDAYIMPQIRAKEATKSVKRDDLIGEVGLGSDLRRDIDVTATMHLELSGSRPYSSYSRTKTTATRASGTLIGTKGGDFQSAMPEIDHLIREHVDDFLIECFGFQGERRITLRDASPGTHKAASLYKDGKFMQALKEASAQRARDKDDHGACFVAALAAWRLDKTEWADKWFDHAISAASSANVSADDYRTVRDRCLGRAAKAGDVSSAPAAARAGEPKDDGVVETSGPGAGQSGAAHSKADQPGADQREGGISIQVRGQSVQLPEDLVVRLRKAMADRIRKDEKPDDIEGVVVLALKQWLEQDAGARGY